VKTLDFRLVLGRSNWLPTPLCSHGLSPLLRHAFVNDVCGHKRKPFGPNCDVLSEAVAPISKMAQSVGLFMGFLNGYAAALASTENATTGFLIA
jgi:hypothetical protein